MNCCLKIHENQYTSNYTFEMVFKENEYASIQYHRKSILEQLNNGNIKLISSELKKHIQKLDFQVK